MTHVTYIPCPTPEPQTQTQQKHILGTEGNRSRGSPKRYWGEDDEKADIVTLSLQGKRPSDGLFEPLLFEGWQITRKSRKTGQTKEGEIVMQKGQGEVCANEVIFHEKVQILKRYVGTYHYSFVKHVPIDNK